MIVKNTLLAIAATAAVFMLTACGGNEPTLDPQKDAEQLVQEQLEIMNSDLNPQEGMEAIQESAHKYTEAYEKAGMLKEYMEMTDIATELQKGKYKEDYEKAEQRLKEKFGGD